MEGNKWSPDFSGGPYRFSNEDNKFIVMGCNTLAYIVNSYNVTGYTTACASVCGSPETLTNGSCLGVGCCQVDIFQERVRDDLDSYRLNPCGYAALVETKSSFNFSSEYITTTKFNETYEGRQPMVLDWAIGNVTCEEAKNMPSYACLHRNSKCVNSTNGPGYVCNCTDGYEGNPYVRNGCTDIDECKLDPSPCPRGAGCHNKEGKYRCPCPPGRKLAKETNSCNPDIDLIIGK